MNPRSIEGPGQETLASRRDHVLATLGDDVMVLPAAAVRHGSRDTELPYAPDRELWYLTGLAEPDTVAVLVGGDEPRTVVFTRPRDPTAELWAGPRLGPEGAGARSGADEAYSLDDFDDVFPGLMAGRDRIHYRLGRDGRIERAVLEALAVGRARGPRTGTGPRGILDPGGILDDMRLRKDAGELTAIREACRVTLIGHEAGSKAVRVGAGEWEIEAAVNGAFRSAGAAGPGFGTIVGSGANACVLHYVANKEQVPEGALVLVDAGADVGLYNGDVTRTWPASGRFSAEQRAVYEVVDAARATAIDTAGPGVTIAAVHEAATAVLVEGLLDLEVLDGSLDDCLESGAHRAFFPHQTSHWLGMDVHDPGDYARDGQSITLEPGMVFTVEPGLYFGQGAVERGGHRFAGIGVRIEDDVAITEDGREVLTADLPTGATEVEEYLDR